MLKDEYFQTFQDTGSILINQLHQTTNVEIF